MNREQLRDYFAVSGLVVLPVIHVLDNAQAERNIDIARNAGCPGVFLINHDFHHDQFLPIIRHCRAAYPDYWIGVNFLAVTGQVAFPILAQLGDNNVRVDGYWADDACIDERTDANQQPEAREILRVKDTCGWNGLYLGGTAFKKQRKVNPVDFARSASIAAHYMDVVTTSGVATGQSADLGKIKVFRDSCGDTPLAVASGITPENIDDYLPWVDAVLVATGINVRDDFYNIDPHKLTLLMNKSGS